MRSNEMLVADHRTGEQVTVEAWVARFARHWSIGAADLEPILGLLSPEVRLEAPGLRATQGKAAARRAFRRAFHAMPDLTADVTGWSARGDSLFIAMTFRATVGKRQVRWSNVDMFRLHQGAVVERVAHYDPSPLRRAFLSSIGGLLQYFRLKAGPPAAGSKAGLAP